MLKHLIPKNEMNEFSKISKIKANRNSRSTRPYSYWCRLLKNILGSFLRTLKSNLEASITSVIPLLSE